MPALKTSGIIKLANAAEPFFRLAVVLCNLFAAVPFCVVLWFGGRHIFKAVN